MTTEDILRLRDTAEQTRVQFFDKRSGNAERKERVTRGNKYDVSCEMVAQSNSRGGMIVVGIDDKAGRINPLSFVEVQETTNLLGSLASEGVVPQILLDIENVQPEGVSMESIKHGASVPRNKLLFNHGINLLPYTGAGSGITRALKFTPNIKFVNDETLNEFVVTVERRDVGETDVRNDRDSDREYRDKRDEEDRDNSLSSKRIENNEAAKRDNDGVEETEDRARVVRTPYRQLPSVQKDIIQFCAIPRTAKQIMDHIGYYNNSKNMTTYVRPLLEMGYLEMTEPDKPQSKNQKYRKVRKE